MCIYLSIICKIALYSVPLYRFHDGVSIYMLLSNVLVTILHFSKWSAINNLIEFSFHSLSLHKVLLKNLLKLEKQIYIYQTPILLLSPYFPYLDLIKTTYFCSLRQQHRNLIGIFSHWAETNICAFHTQYQCQNWPE